MSGLASRGKAPGTVGGPGLFQVDHDGARVAFQRLLRHPIEEVWAAITDPEQLEVWFMAKVKSETATGTLDMHHISGVHAAGRVLEWSPPRVYEYEWNVESGPGLPQGEYSIVRWELTPTKEGTLLVLTHRRLTQSTARVFARGLKVFLDRLAAHLDGAPLPEPSWLAQAPKPFSTDGNP